MKRWILIALFLLIILPVAAFGLWSWMTLNFVYSKGDRTGYLQKISNKGWICKTWEGEMVMTTQPGVAPQVFQFTVRDEGVAQQLLKLTGQRVSLAYEEHRGVPSSCFGETSYYVSKAQGLGQ